ncbi:hypothetical protein QCA50_017308 [Cerrena zonata]|uniref:DUF6593 domain-containing protein n=1 Tax=Cerrena zonata TaxID=2478898 RepID=A0AAW0FH73_9APHY
MDSQLTLVDTSVLPDREASSTLIFSPDSLLNTTLSLRGTNRPVYKVQTSGNATRTEVFRIIPGSVREPPLVVRINRNEIFPDKITFHGVPTLKTNQWLKKNTFTNPHVENASYSGSSKRFVWKPTNTREIALYKEDFPSSPIAWFRSSSLCGEPEPAYLALKSEAENMQDAVLASLIIVEQRYRVKHKRGGLPPRGNPIWIPS